MKKYFIFSLLLNIQLLLSCDKKLFNVNCDDCLSKEPAEVKLIITSDSYKDGMYREPEIRVYEGNIEDSILVNSKIAPDNPTYISVYINKKYTVTATYYYFHSKSYIVVDTVIPRVDYESDKCDNPCYFVKNNKVNLTLKYS
jgi:hypothetical protein